jgi:(E)-4-hydroxy-3-methylbut-2-enyl-diphosphate synthase
MVEAALPWDKAVRIGVNWGSLDQELLATLMDENARRAQPWDAKQVMYEALVQSALDSADQARGTGHGPRPDHHQLQGQRRAGPDRGLPRTGGRCDYPLHLGLTEAGMGTKGTVASAVALAVLLQKASATPSASA